MFKPKHLLMKNIQPTICKHLPLEALSQTPIKHNPFTCKLEHALEKSRSKQKIEQRIQEEGGRGIREERGRKKGWWLPAYGPAGRRGHLEALLEDAALVPSLHAFGPSLFCFSFLLQSKKKMYPAGACNELFLLCLLCYNRHLDDVL